MKWIMQMMLCCCLVLVSRYGYADDGWYGFYSVGNGKANVLKTEVSAIDCQSGDVFRVWLRTTSDVTISMSMEYVEIDCKENMYTLLQHDVVNATKEDTQVKKYISPGSDYDKLRKMGCAGCASLQK